MTDFLYEDLLPVGADETPISAADHRGGVDRRRPGRPLASCQCEPEALRLLTETAIHDISHYLRPASSAAAREHPRRSGGDEQRQVRRAGSAQERQHRRGRRPADVPGHRHRDRDGQARPARAHPRRRRGAHRRGVYDAYTRLNLRYSQIAPVTMWDERNTGPTCPPRSSCTPTRRPATRPPTSSCSWPRAAAAPTSRTCSRRPRRSWTPTAMLRFLDEKLRGLGTAACPPYHLAIVVGGTGASSRSRQRSTSSTKYLDELPKAGDATTGHGFRDMDLEEKVLELTRQFGIGAQFGGKYFCHDVRVVPPAPPRRLAAGRDRGVLLGRPPGHGKITPEGVFIEQLEIDPAGIPARGHRRRPRRRAGGCRGRRRRPARVRP